MSLPSSFRAPTRPRGTWVVALAALLGAFGAGCQTDLGPCDVQAARSIVYTDDSLGSPAYAGQALIIQSCGSGSYCHAASATDRLGVPAGLDFDLRLATTAEETERLRDDQWTVYRFRDSIYEEVRHGYMPPGAVGAEVAAAGPRYRDLPPLDSAEARSVLRNWLSCGVPVVERMADDRPPGVEPVGAIVAPSPTVDASSCAQGLEVCQQMCVDTTSDPANCGTCDLACSGSEVCYDGGCLAGGCPGGTTDCGGACVDTTSSSAHCGDCTTTCGTNRTCSASACVCVAGLTDCGGACVDTDTNTAHCGGCNSPCGAGEACEGGVCVTCGEGISFAADIQPIFTNSCGGRTGCHLTTTRPAGNLSLLAGKSYAQLVNVPADACAGRVRVVPGSPETSYLIDKLRARNMCRGVQMPASATPLSEPTLQLLEAWICGGAPNN